MGYAPVVHMKEARMSTLIVDDELTMAEKNLNVAFIHEGYSNSDIQFYNDVRIDTIKEFDAGAGTKIINPASTALFTLAASDEVRASDLSTPYGGTYGVRPTTLTKLSELEVPMYYYKGGTVRAKVSASSIDGSKGEVRFFVDGTAAGPAHAFYLGYDVISDDIEVTPGALIQVYGIAYNNNILVKDFQICADDVIHNGIKGALW